MLVDNTRANPPVQQPMMNSTTAMTMLAPTTTYLILFSVLEKA